MKRQTNNKSNNNKSINNKKNEAMKKELSLNEVESVLINTLKDLAAKKDYTTLKSGKLIAAATNIEGLNFGTPKILSSGAKDARFFDYKGEFLPKRLHNYYNAAFGTQSVTDLEATNNGNISIYSNEAKRVQTINRKNRVQKSCTALLDDLFAAFIERAKKYDIEYNGEDSIKVFAAKVDQRENELKEAAKVEAEKVEAAKLKKAANKFSIEQLKSMLAAKEAAAAI